MTEIINLKRARKEKQRQERETEAAANRQLFGRTRAQKKLDRDTAERARQTIDGKRLTEDEKS